MSEKPDTLRISKVNMAVAQILNPKPPSRALRRLLSLHQRWVETDGRAGRQFIDEGDGPDLSGLHLDGVNFRKAKMLAAQFVGCSLIGADFRQADLQGSLFRGSDLTRASFEEAILDFTAFENNRTDGTSFTGASVRMANIRPAHTPAVAASDFEL